MSYSKDGFQNYIPNGQVKTCLNCHFSINGGDRNVFGKAAEKSISNKKVMWDKIFNLDSDGDGFTNGEELQDADGQWVIGQSAPGNPSLVTNPGDASSKPTETSVEDDFVNNNSIIYPVPSKGIVNLNYVSNYPESSRLEIFNSNGNLIVSEKVESVFGENNYSIDLNNLSLNHGIYYLILRNKYFNIRKRIVFSK